MSAKTFLTIYAVINFVTLSMYGVDKQKAKQGRWRVKESTLLLMGALGAPGQILGMRLFRHKTRKWYFVRSAILFAVAQAYAIFRLFADGLIK